MSVTLKSVHNNFQNVPLECGDFRFVGLQVSSAIRTSTSCWRGRQYCWASMNSGPEIKKTQVYCLIFFFFTIMTAISPIPQEVLALISVKSRCCIENLLQYFVTLEHADLSVIRTFTVDSGEMKPKTFIAQLSISTVKPCGCIGPSLRRTRRTARTFDNTVEAIENSCGPNRITRRQKGIFGRKSNCHCSA